ncbi:uncharacterized protein J3D65DRAFT_422944 [Phyllosticta citribraziliensis]|uniref:Uncharacterized protein n=1 Tax=Phyllosticta citribraziliensis TaxID=989973 RepID=A0ABR1LHT5_9PEZI
MSHPDSRPPPTHPCRLLTKIFSSFRSVGQVGRRPLARPRPVNAPLKITISPCPPARSGRFTALPCLFFSQCSPCVCCSREQSQSCSQSLVPLSFAPWLRSESVGLSVKLVLARPNSALPKIHAEEGASKEKSFFCCSELFRGGALALRSPALVQLRCSKHITWPLCEDALHSCPVWSPERH